MPSRQENGNWKEDSKSRKNLILKKNSVFGVIPRATHDLLARTFKGVKSRARDMHQLNSYSHVGLSHPALQMS